MAKTSAYQRLARLSAIIMILPSCMAGSGGFGYFVVDRFGGVFPWGTVIFTLLGGGIGFYQIFRILTAKNDETAEGE
jgi:F0F1-type ATP synthase assembly protein I